ncbi:MAG TPA: glycosyl hydrolase 108 family protein [Nitrososphaeraceae archaeon]
MLYEVLNMAQYPISLNLLLSQEGSYVCNEDDPGGATKYGVSLRYLRNQKLLNGDIDDDGDIDENDIKLLTYADVEKLYRIEFWDKNNLSRVKSQRIANMIFCNCVNMGPVRAIKILQKSLNIVNNSNLKEDGILGEETIDIINDTTESALLATYKDRCRLFYMLIAAKNKKLQQFLRGWIRRVNTY